MKACPAAAAALLAASSLHAQTPATPPAVDYSTAAPMEGNWIYATVTGGTEARFVNASAQSQLTVRCARPTRQVTISKAATGAASLLTIWTSALTRSLPASYDPAAANINAVLNAYDPLLDAIAFSRGRVAFSVSGQATLVVPSWPEAARVIEDCRV